MGLGKRGRSWRWRCSWKGWPSLLIPHHFTPQPSSPRRRKLRFPPEKLEAPEHPPQPALRAALSTASWGQQDLRVEGAAWA